jgi:predicted permease
MRWAERLRMMVVMLFQRERETERLDNELQFHLEQQVSENMALGMSPVQARTAALRMFGNPAVLREEARSSWSWNWLDKSWRDLRYGARTLRRSPGFALVAVIVMALGIGATTSLFTIVRSVLLKPLPFPESDKLVMVYEHFRHGNSDGSFNYNPVAPGDFHDWREQTHGFQDMAAWHFWGANLAGEHAELPEVVVGAAGSWNLFSVLGVQPAMGRAFTSDEDREGVNNVVMLSWSLFQRRFSGDPAIVGKQIRLDSKPYTIVGVLPKSFTYPDVQVQLWVPYASTFLPGDVEKHDDHQSLVIARLKDSVSAAVATQEVSALQYRIHMENQSLPVAEDAVSRPMIDDVVEDVKTPLLVLLGAVGCMLLIACLNVSNLLVARGAARRKEVAVRGALGGSRLTLIREQLTESLLICVAGGALGLLLSYSATNWLAGHWRDLPRADAIHIDGTVMAFALGLVFLSALLAGLLPAISSTGKVLFTTLQDSSRSIGGSTSKASLRKILLTAEIALTVVLLLAAGLLFKSFLHLRTADLGCPTDNVLTIKYGLPDKQYAKPEQVIAFHEGLLERVRHLPGVRAAALVSTAPGSGYEGDRVFTIPEHPSNGPLLQNDALVRSADPGYFSALQIPLLSGRVFSDQERLDRYHYVIVSKKFAEQFFPGESPLGKHLNTAWTGKDELYEIIGVVGDTLYDVSRPVKATMYFPILAGISQASAATIVVRASGEPLALATPVQKQVEALDPALPVYDVYTMQQVIGRSTASQSFSATMVLAFAALSLLLAAVGLYGVLSYLVMQRVTEIGIRMALGAQRTEVLRLVFLDGIKPVLIGLLIGLVGGAGAGVLIRSILYGTRPLDPAVFAAMVTALLLTAMVACVVPALRASRIEPMEALRSQ